MYKALKALDVQALLQVARDHPEYSVPAETLAAFKTDKDEDAFVMLRRVFDSGTDPGSGFISKYLAPESGIGVKIAPGITAQLPINRDAVGLTLAELHQERGEVVEAINVAEQLEPTTYAAVSLADLYIEAGRHDDAVEVTEGIKNEDDCTALLNVYRAIAFREQGHYQAAKEAFKEALRSKKRDPVIRHKALFERHLTHLAEGKKAAAKKDLETILAEDSDYPGLQEQIATLP